MYHDDISQPRSDQGLSSLPPLSMTMEAEKRDPGNEVGFFPDFFTSLKLNIINNYYILIWYPDDFFLIAGTSLTGQFHQSIMAKDVSLE